MQLASIVKFITALVGAALIAVQTGLADGGLSNNDWVTIGLALVTALGVYSFPNSKPVEDEDPESKAGEDVPDPTV